MELACDTGSTNASAVLEPDTSVALGLSRAFVVDVIEDGVDVLELTGNEDMA